MSLRFIFGRAGSGKSRFCLENIKKSVLDNKDDKKIIYLVPEQFTFQADKNLVYTLGEKGIHKVQVLSFTRMAQVVLAEVGGITRLHMKSSGRNMLIYKILDEVKDKLKVFSRASKQQGFVDIMSDIISEFKRYNINPEELDIVLTQLNDNEVLKDKIQDISLIFQKFEEYLHKNYIDTEDELMLLVEKLKETSIYDGAEIWIDEFSTFTPLQYNVIEQLFLKCKRVNITLTTDCLINGGNADNTDVFMPIKNTENKLVNIAAKNNIPYEKPICLDEETPFRFKESKEIAHLEKYFFKFPYNIYSENTKDVSIFRGLNMYSEIRNTASNIIRLVRDENLRFKDIAVVTRDLGNYEKLVEAIFTEYNIPYFIDKRRDINSNPLIILLNSVMEIFTKNWSYESVFRYLKTGLIDIEREEIDIIENYVLSNGIRGKKWFEDEWNYSFEYNFNNIEKEEESFQRINDIKNKIANPLIKLQNKVKGKNKVKEICTNIYEFLVEIKAGEKIENFVLKFEREKQLDLANEYSQVWNVVMDLLSQLVEVLGEEEVKLEEFIKIMRIGINEYDVGVIPASLDEVLVGDIERVKSHEVSAIFIIGVNDGIFPRISDKEGILNDKDRENLKNLGIEIAGDTKSQAFEEQFLIYRALTIGGKYLRISYPIADFEGKSMRPSIIISRMKKIFPKIKEESDIIKGNSDEETLREIVGESSTFNELIAAIKEETEGKEINPIWWDAYRWYLKDEKWRERCKRAFSGLSYKNQVSKVDSNKIKKLYGYPLKLSVSRLERYAQCPFAYYIQYGLKAQERKIYDFSMPDLGTFLHEVLDEFANVLDKEAVTFRDVDEKFTQEAITQIVEEKINGKTGYILNSSPRYKYISNKLKRVLVKSVNIISEHVKRSKFNPVGHEVSFESKGDYPPIDIILPSGDKIELIGRIDRVDELETENGIYIRIIDYKSGNKAFKLSDVYYGLQLQLLIYLDAIISNKEKYIEKGVIPGGIFYFKIDDPIVKVDGNSNEDEIKKAILRELKMKGILLKDIEIIKAMDLTITETKEGYSLIIPARVTQKSGVVDNHTSSATLEEFEILRKYARKMVINICEDMLNGNISIKPYKQNKNTPCEYCEFKSICQFDASIKENKYKYLNEKKNEEIWTLMKKEIEKEDI
ncbi:DNA helicase/exodeoxyribonuclease V, subunit B [Clostridium sp. USBA 49]|uniref:helicase-exonuclease AddAB subunit AddB n=1 Tax=Clostridium sp. USBA 49 TaxID=1881060 RepID=UPI00099A4C68|nr:helicase-exonuclease AddAB subunit AddB [Clostridium sp. USBA 49]SKA89872.1 DNA helicase/exodeoxyribonuclease V, subunit B [Clostridium sp. USBA 49]